MATAPLTKIGYTRLSANSGLKVSKLILGCMGFGDPNWAGGWVVNESDSLKVIEEALNLGINSFDNSNVYSDGESERILGRAIRTLNISREEVVIMTKCFFAMDKNPPSVVGNTNLRGLSRKHIFDAVKGSLERLQMDYVDVFQCHRFDDDTPIEETMDALHDIVKLGYARYIGMSSCYAWQFHKMQNYAISKGQTAFISMQNLHNPIYREEEREMMPTLEHFGVGMIPWSPLARGYLTRPFDQQAKTVRQEKDPHFTMMPGFGHEEVVSQDINRAIEKVAISRGKSMAQISIAWSLSHSIIAAPIIGTTRPDSLRELVEATTLILTPEEIQSISAPYSSRRVAGIA